MSQPDTKLDEATRVWIGAQRLFFVATAPLAAGGHVNCSPKGLESLRVLDATTLAYLDHVGSGAETIAHLRENGRICIMLCAFEGPPRILRIHGRGRPIEPSAAEWPALLERCGPPPRAALRSVILVEITRVQASCGYGVPRYDFVAERSQLPDWSRKKGPDAVREYQRTHNRSSIDGLPALRWTRVEREDGP